MSEAEAMKAPEFIDVSDMAYEVGFPQIEGDTPIKVWLAPAVFMSYVIWKDADTERQVWQDQTIRMWKILSASLESLLKMKNKFRYRVIPRDGHSRTPVIRTITLLPIHHNETDILIIHEEEPNFSDV